MFVTENVRVLFKRANLKLVQEQGELHRVAEATFVLEPLLPELAHELGEDIAGHLFDDDEQIRPELDVIGVRMSTGLQIVTSRDHEDLKVDAELKPVRILTARVERVEDDKTGKEWLRLVFVLSFQLRDREARKFVLDKFGSWVCLSFKAMQEDLLDDEMKARPGVELARRFTKKMQAGMKDGTGIDSMSIGLVDPKTGKVEKGVTITKDDVTAFGESARG